MVTVNNLTCIIGYVDKNDGSIYIGGDSAATSGTSITHIKDKKVFYVNQFLIGCAGSPRTLQAVQYSFDPPEQPKDMSTKKYMSTLFINTLRECLKNAGIAEKDKEKEEFDSFFLIGYKGRLFRIESNYAVIEDILPFDSIGCGSRYANGALYVLMNDNSLSVEERIYKALFTAGALDNCVDEPYYVLKLENKNTKENKANKN